MNYPRLWHNLRKLKRDFPLSKPVEVRTFGTLMDGEDRLFGTAELVGNRYKIQIARFDESTMIDTLWHEWTHCLLWPRCRYRHTKTFWTAYGRIYSHYQDQ